MPVEPVGHLTWGDPPLYLLSLRNCTKLLPKFGGGRGQDAWSQGASDGLLVPVPLCIAYGSSSYLGDPPTRNLH